MISTFKVFFNKQKYDVSLDLESTTLLQLKEHLHSVIGIQFPKEMQKIVVKGQEANKNEQSLQECGIVAGSKIMVIGSSYSDVNSLSQAATTSVTDEKQKLATTEEESFSQQKIHKTILDKGPPDDVMPGLKDVQVPLPHQPLFGMVNRSGGKVRLTFKLESDEVWIGTKERTEKINMPSIKKVVNEPIDGFPEYQIIGFQLGTSAASRYWIYWLPSQYVEAVKENILGKWHYF